MNSNSQYVPRVGVEKTLADGEQKVSFIEGRKVAVLVSGGYGAGWSTWNRGDSRMQAMLMFSPSLIDMVENGRECELDQSVVSALLWEDYPNTMKAISIEDGVRVLEGEEIDFEPFIYTGGRKGLYVAWLPLHTPFVIEEYDGSESIRTLDDFLSGAFEVTHEPFDKYDALQNVIISPERK